MNFNQIKIFIFNFIKKNNILIIAFLYITFIKLFSVLMKSNELDILATAKHFINPDWINNDWYLNLGIEYRYLFNIFAGFLSLFMPLWLVEVIGRIIIYYLFAYLIQEYSHHLNLKVYLIVFFIYFYFIFESVIAGEWIIRSFETKSFSYFFCLLSILTLIDKKYFKTFLFLGLSFSFHVLVGIYALICVIFSIILNINYFKDDLIKMLKSIFIYFFSGLLGIYAILKILIKNNDFDKKLAGEIYVTLRNPHHTYPLNWEGYIWIIKLILFILFLIILFLYIKDTKYKILSSFTFSSVIFFIIGFIIYWSGKIYLLKYYWFRFPDAIIPFFSILLIFSFINRILTSKILFFNNHYFSLLKKGFIYLLIFISIITVYFDYKIFIKKVLENYRAGKYFYVSGKDKKIVDTLLWVKKNSQKDSVFFVEPSLSYFYIVAERAMFVSFKHSPSSEKDIIEWYNRIELCQDFYNMREDKILEIAQKYKVDFYLGKNNANYSFKKVYENNSYALYLINK